MEEDFKSKDIYLTKESEIIGLHSVGFYEGEKWVSLEQWGNEYDQSYHLLGRGSFRVFQDLEIVAQEMEAEGWTRFERKEIAK